MTRLRRIVGIAAVGVAATMSAFVATTPAPAVSPFAARAQSNTCAGRYSDRVRTPHNKAGVVFHPHGDDFEIWNNSHNHPAHPVKVLYRYCYPTSNNWRNPIWSSIDHTPFPGIRKDMKEYPYYVAFIIWSPEETANGGWSEQVHYRTFGS